VKTNGRLKEGVFFIFLFFITEANQDAFLRKCHSCKIEDSVHITVQLYMICADGNSNNNNSNNNNNNNSNNT